MIGIIDYGAGNTRSIANTLTKLGENFVLSRKPETLDACDKILFPGVGAAGTAMANLKQHNIDAWIKECTKPFLGICLGFQVLFEESRENDTECLGIFSGTVTEFKPTKLLPHMGWNYVETLPSSVFPSDYFFFAHSFCAPISSETCASCTYEDDEFSAVVVKNNFWGAQFHPEKSGKAGQEFLSLFLGHE